MIRSTLVLQSVACSAVGIAATVAARELRPILWLSVVFIAFLAGLAGSGPAWVLAIIATAPVVLAGPALADGRPLWFLLVSMAVMAVLHGAVCLMAAVVGLRLHAKGSRHTRHL